MQRDTINYAAVGLFVLIAFGVLLAVLYRVTGHDTGRDTYFAIFGNIDGLRIGSSVAYAGYQVGSVENIVPERQEGRIKYRLRLGIVSGWRIPVDSVARIIRPGMLSDVQVDIAEGLADEPLQLGGTLRGEALADPLVTFVRVGSQVESLLAELRGYIGSVGGSVDQDLPKIVTKVAKLLDTLQVTADQLTTLTAQSNQTKVTNALTNAEEISARLLELATAFEATSNQINSFMSSTNSLIQENRGDLRRAVADLRETLAVVRGEVEGVANNLSATSRNMSEFSRQLRDNPGVLLGGKPAVDQLERQQ